MKLYFVRHGKTVWNLERRFQGMTGDSPLLEESYEQTAILGDYLADIEFKKVLVSPSKRAQDTAKGIIEKNKNPLIIDTDKRLYEWKLGNLEGREIEKVTEQFPEQIFAFRNNPAEFDGSIFGAENVFDVIARIKEVVVDLDNDPTISPNDNILIVSHGATLTSSIQSLIGTPNDQLRKDGILSNSSLTIVDVKNPDNIELIEWNKIVY